VFRGSSRQVSSKSHSIVLGDIELTLGGRRILCDVSVIQPCAPTYVQRAAATTGAAIHIVETRKKAKYAAELAEANNRIAALADANIPRVEYVPLVVEAYGRWSDTALQLFKMLGQRRSHGSGVATRTARSLVKDLLMRMDVILQRYNGQAILDITGGAAPFDDIFNSSVPVNIGPLNGNDVAE